METKYVFSKISWLSSFASSEVNGILNSINASAKPWTPRPTGLCLKLEFSASLGESGVGLTFGDYDEIGKYTISSYDLPFDLAGLTVSLSWNDIDYDDGLAKDDDVFAITFSM